MFDHRLVRTLDIVFAVLLAQPRRLDRRVAFGDVAVQFIVGRGLVGDNIRNDSATEYLREDFGTIANQTD